MPRSVQVSAPPFTGAYAEASYTSAYQPFTQQPGSSYYSQNGYGMSTPASSNACPATAYPATAFQVPSQAAQGYGRTGAYDPEEEARIAEWQSAYTPKDDAKKASQNTNRAITAESAATPDTDGGPSSGNDKGKQKTVMRHGGGKTWEDPSLLDWNPLHPRLYVGNLAGEVTDESLFKAFSKYSSVSKARVVRDKKSTKSKGFGFVSFSETDDYFRAAKEMEGKYIGSHPVKVTRANTEIKATAKKDTNRKGPKQPKAKGGIAGQLLAANNYTVSSGIQKTKKGSKHAGPKFLG
ncbi:RNA-binding domain-containing protein [Polyplosphaeria fusca]|uniref:RNA-binding domain-containing protein n=1 Tax=Polyplosphaeria fusca TaxID=682080 RepID=A0A9P4R234_9PLEO|nr:RNA-binding domain-containing protein [Polyplosphaeria fusca]